MGCSNSSSSSIAIMGGLSKVTGEVVINSPLDRIKGKALVLVVAFLRLEDMGRLDAAISSHTLRASVWLPTVRESDMSEAFDLMSRLDLGHDKQCGRGRVEGDPGCDMIDRIKAHSGDAILQLMHGYDARNAARMQFKSLDVSQCQDVTPGGLKRIGSCPALEELNISNLNLDDAALADLSFNSWKSAELLRKLDASENLGITDEGLRHLQDLASLEEIRLRGCTRITNEGIRRLSALTKLIAIDVTGCNVDDGGLSFIKELSGLKSLRLPGTHLTDVGVEQLTCLGAIEDIDISGCDQLTDAALESIGQLISLRRLNLRGCALISDKGLAHLVSLKNLHALRLPGCHHISVNGLWHLTLLPSLRYLNLSACSRLDDACMRVLARISNLQDLCIDDCPLITDQGMAALEDSHRLHAVSVLRCPLVTAPSLRRLREIGIVVQGCSSGEEEKLDDSL